MRKIKILAIAPYEGMAETFLALTKDREDIDITIRTGDLQEGLRIAKELAYQDYDVIISRGGTADLIRSEIDTPVIDAPLSPYDMLRSIKMTEHYSGKFAVAGFQSITNCARMLCDLLQIDMDIYTFESSSQVLPILQSLKEQNYSLIICDMIGSITAQQVGLNSILIPSGTESITAAINEAIKLVQASRHTGRQRDIFKSVLLSAEDDFVIFDSRQNLWFSTLPHNTLQPRILNMLKTFLPAFVKTDDQTFERQLEDTIFLITNQHLFYDGEQYTLLKLKQKPALFSEEDNSICICNQPEQKDAFPTNNSANYIGDVHIMMEEYGKTSFPILICGEAGTGKDRAAQLLYQKGPFSNAPFYTIDCGLLTERKWTSLLNHENSPLNNIHVTIYFKNINQLSTAQISKFFTYCSHTNLHKRNRLLFSVIDTHQNTQELRNSFGTALSSLVLQLPPLRERISDIPSITTLYINELNASLGKQIVGFDHEALDLICNFSWPQNLNQFHRVLRELVIITKTSYISADSVRSMLKQETAGNYNNPSFMGGTSIDLNQTLDDINYDIIRMTLQQEHMNKEKAAKRLGISRSTLWRILKAHEEH